jgi:hypothetical protein
MKIKNVVFCGTSCVIAMTAQAWTSSHTPLSRDIHQQAIEIVLAGLLDKSSISILQEQQSVIDKDQRADQSAEHCMTGINAVGQSWLNQSPRYIAAANDLVRNSIEAARTAAAQGHQEQSMRSFAIALHALEDSTSPAHEGFQIWSDSFGVVEMANHMFAERAYPSDSDPLHRYKARLEGSVRYAFNIYKGKDMMPTQFFDAKGVLQLPREYWTGAN